jgi:hypothetical protein
MQLKGLHVAEMLEDPSLSAEMRSSAGFSIDERFIFFGV